MSRTKETMAADIETSLKNMRTDYIDLYQVHNPSMAQLEQVVGAGGALEALLEAKAAGKIGHIGLTAHDLAVFEKGLELDWVETIMFPYNIVETHGTDLIAKCKEKNIGFVDMKPLAGGAIDDAILALRFICANENVTVVIPGMYDVKEVKQNVAAVNDKTPICEEEMAKMEAIRKDLGKNFCRRCNYCQPCPQGVGISGAFLMQGYLRRYGLGEWAKGRYMAMPVKASACVECGLCETRCPYNLPIREMLKTVVEDFGE